MLQVDALKTKRDLLDCVDSLTNGRRILDEDKMIEIEESGVARISENDLKILVTEQTGWPYFKDIFMVSALTGNGVGDIQVNILCNNSLGLIIVIVVFSIDVINIPKLYISLDIKYQERCKHSK